MTDFKRLVFLTLAASALLSGAPAAAQAPTGLFNTLEIPSSNLTALPQWQHVRQGFAPLAKRARLCDQDIQECKSQQMTLWRTKIQELEHAEDMVKLRQINGFINKWQKASDQDIYQQKDYWATPLEFIINGGDSEDFAIMKYVSLKELGISPDAMRIVVTNDVLRGVTHTILTVKLNTKTYILDSQNNTVLEQEFVKYYVPFYSVNETTRWAHIPQQISSLGDAAGTKK